jgi:periplasmic protein TonB
MKRSLVIFYAVALGFHVVVLFYLKPPAPRPPKMIERTYVDIALTAPPAPEPPKPQPPPPIPQPKIEPPPPQPKLEPKPEPEPPPKPEMTMPTPKPEPPPPVAPPVAIPQPKPPTEYVSVTQPNYAKRAEPIYPEQARRWRQQGIVVLALYINEFGTLDKVEIVKSSGFQLLDAAAVKAMKQSQFAPAMDGATPIRSRAEATVTFKLE